MKVDAKFSLDGCRADDLRAEDMDFMAAPAHFRDEINRLRRAAAGRRIKRLMR